MLFPYDGVDADRILEAPQRGSDHSNKKGAPVLRGPLSLELASA